MERLSFELDPAGGWFVAAAFVLLALMGLAAAWRKRTVPLSGRFARLVLVARAGALLVLLLPLFRPAVVRKTEVRRKVPLLVALDSSRSMTIRRSKDSPSRWEEAVAFVGAEAPRFRSLSESYDLSWALFDGTFHPFDLEAEPDGTRTAIGDVIGEWRKKLAPGEPGALLLISDGVNNSGADPFEAAAPLKPEGRRVYAVGVGGGNRAESAVDASVEEIELPSELNTDQKFVVAALLRTRGLGGALLKVELYIDGRKAAEREIAVRGAETLERVEFERPPLPAGNRLVRVRVVPVPLEANTENNSMETYLKVRKGTVRVLYIESRLRYEYMFVRRVLRRMAGVEMKTAVLRGPSRGSVTEDDIAAADVIIIGDLPASLLGTKKLAAIAARVREGASLLTLGGYSAYGSGGWPGTPVGDIIPFESSAADAQIVEPALFLPTQEGTQEDFLQIFGEKLGYNELRKRYEKLPKLGGYVRTSGVRPLASLLAASDKGDPLMALMEVGEGKVVSLAVDTTYHWAFNSRRGRDDTFPCFERFWRRLVLYLAGKSHGEGFSVEIRAARTLLSPGESAPFEVTVTDERGRPVRDAKVEVEMESASGARTALALTADGDVLRGSAAPPREGHYTLRAVARREKGEEAKDEVKLIVVERDRETAVMDTDFGLLSALADRTGGAFAPAGDAREVFLALARNAKRYRKVVKKRVRLWSSTWALLAFVLFLAVEWAARKKRGLP